MSKNLAREIIKNDLNNLTDSFMIQPDDLAVIEDIKTMLDNIELPETVETDIDTYIYQMVNVGLREDDPVDSGIYYSICVEAPGVNKIVYLDENIPYIANEEDATQVERSEFELDCAIKTSLKDFCGWS